MQRLILRVYLPLFLVAIIVLIYLSPETAALLYGAALFLMPLWLPLLLFRVAWPLWIRFAQTRFLSNVAYVLVELKPGPDTPPTAKPMELLFYSLYHRVDITRKDFLLGRIRLPWAFEVYVTAGTARFFAHLPADHLPAFESRFRAEYRDAEVYEVADYLREIPFRASSMRAVLREYTLAKPDPYPIATYPARESGARHDPFTEMLEELSAAGAGEHLVLSYIIRPHQRERARWLDDPKDTLHEDAHRVIATILGPKGELHTLSHAEQSLIAAIEGALKKPSFDCGLRALYLAENARFDEERAGKLDTLFSRFDDEDLNGFAAYDPTERVSALAREAFAVLPHLATSHALGLCRRRAFFPPSHAGERFVLNTEELATVFHLPPAGRGGASRPGVKLEPPENLPV